MKCAKKIAVFVFAIWMAFILPYGIALVQQLSIQNTGQLIAVGIETSGSSIDWGMISPGESKSCDVTLTNTGNQPITVSMITSNWNPGQASTYLILTWNYAGETISAGSWQTVTFTLHAAADTDPSITTFSFDIIITGTQVA